MRNVLRTLVIGVSAVAFAATLSAAQAAKTTPGKAAAPKSAVVKSASKSATGKISRYDSASRTLTITTAKGDQNFVLGDKATVHEGSKTIAADELSSRTGENAKIRYAEANGKMTAEMVTVAAKKAAGKASTKKPGK